MIGLGSYGHSLGIKSGGHRMTTRRLGHKGGGDARAGIKKAWDHSEDIGATAGQVEDIAGKVASGATAGAGLLALTGIGEPVAAGLLGVAGLAKGVQTGAGMVKESAGKASQVKGLFSRLGL